ncbi:Major facilitator superfamily multidrug transporter mfsB [Exophiala dermatitidis]
MRLTWKKTNNGTPSDDDFPTTQFFILSICRIAEPVAITAIFPYAWLMVKGFGMHDASFYAGILIASFSLSESLTSLFWGGLSDRIGRKPVLLLGCFGTMLSLIMVGFSTNFTMALAGRIIGGALNGNIGVIQSIVGELVTKPEYEPKAYSIMPFVWSIGTIIGPAIGGLLADPAKSYPNQFSRDGFFGRYPWALPNLVCAAFMLISIICGFFWLDETHPDFRRGADATVHHDITEQTPMISAAGANADPGVDLRRDSFGTFNEVDMPKTQHWELNPDGTSRAPSLSENDREKWLTKKVVMLTVALGLYTYHSMCYDHLLPIFFQDRRIDHVTVLGASPIHIPGGLGLNTKDVGVILSVNGVIALFIQAVIFPLAAERLGIWRTFVMVTILHPVAFFIVPYLALLPENLVYPGIYTCLTIRNLLSILDYPVILILLKQASPSLSVLGRINGLAASAGAACRTVAPPIAGLLYGWGQEIGFTGLAWWAAGAVAIVGVFQLWFVPREKSQTTIVKSILPCLDNPNEEMPSDVVDITVVDDEDDDDFHM